MLPRSGLRYPVTMLMKVVLPAPLVPIRPTTESFSMAALTSFAAVTAPKLLVSPCASRMTDITVEERPEPLRQENDQDEKRRAEAHLPGVRRKVVRQRMDRAVDQRPDERRDHVARAGEDRDEDELARGGPVGHFGIDMPDRGRRERAADAGEPAGDHVFHVHRPARRGP